MPSTLVHVAIAGLLATALLGRSFDRESVLVVLGATALIDFDAFLGPVIDGAHRSLFHNYLLVALAVGLLYYDARVREESLLAAWRPDGARVAGVAVLAVAAAGIGLDMVHNGVNVFWPLHDQFYTVDGRLQVSSTDGVVQTFVDPADFQGLLPDLGGGAGSGATGTPTEEPPTTNNTHYRTGVDPSKGSEPEQVERTFYVLASGRDLLVTLLGFGTVGSKLRTAED
jgi:hypothetical protein